MTCETCKFWSRWHTLRGEESIYGSCTLVLPPYLRDENVSTMTTFFDECSFHEEREST